MIVVQVRLGFDDTFKLMKELDKDGDDKIDYREFVSFLRDRGSKGGAGGDDSRPSSPRGSSGASGGGGRRRREYTIADKVADELRTKFDAAIADRKIRSYEEVFEAMDKNGDGRVSRREFESGMRDMKVPARHRSFHLRV